MVAIHTQFTVTTADANRSRRMFAATTVIVRGGTVVVETEPLDLDDRIVLASSLNDTLNRPSFVTFHDRGGLHRYIPKTLEQGLRNSRDDKVSVAFAVRSI